MFMFIYYHILNMPHLYYFELDNYYYKQYFENINGDLEKQVRNEMIYLHDYLSDNNKKKLSVFLDEILNIHLNNLVILAKYDLHTQYLPNRDESILIFNEMKKRIKENDIISIYDYRGCGQYYVYNENDSLKIVKHSGEYGREYPPESTKYFMDNKIYEYMINENLDAFYTKFNVFYELYRKNLELENQNYCTTDSKTPCKNNNYAYNNFGVCGSGIYISLSNYDVVHMGSNIRGYKYVLLCYYEENTESIIIKNKTTNDVYTINCTYYETDVLD